MRIDRTAVLSATIAAALCPSVTRAADKFWDGPVNNLWTNPNNWSGGEPLSGDSAVFDGAVSVVRNEVLLNANRSVLEMRVTGVPSPGPYVFTAEGGVLTASAGVNILGAAGSVNFNGFRTSSHWLQVDSGATLNLLTNAHVTAGAVDLFGGVVNWNAGSITTATGGAINVNGGTMNVTAGGRGLGPDATLAITGGGRFTSNNYFDIGSSADVGNGPAGTLSVSGAGSTYAQTAGLTPFWGHNAGDNADVTFASGAVGTLASGVSIATNGGSAQVDVTSGARLHVAGPLSVGTSPPPASVIGQRTNAGNQTNGAASVNALINLAGGTLSTAAPAFFGSASSVNVTGSGLLQLGADTIFSTGSTFSGSPSGGLSMAPNTTLWFDGGVGTLSSPFSYGGGRTVRITNGGQVTAGRFDLAGGAANLLVDGPTSRLSISASSGWGNVNGDTATITFSNGGVGTNSGEFQIGYGSGNALVNVTSGARLTSNATTFGFGIGHPSSGSVTINVNGGTLNTPGQFTIRGNAVVNYSAGSMSTGLLNMFDTSRVLLSPTGNKVLRANGLAMSGTSKIDLADNDMIVGSLTPKSTIAGYVATARNGGGWDGPRGITSSAAASHPQGATTLGVLSGAEYTSVGGDGTFSGQPYSASDTLVKYTWYGDTDFNGFVDGDDYARIDNGFNFGFGGWLNGDSDLNGFVDGDDYALIDLAFNVQSGTLRQAINWISGDDRSIDMNSSPALRRVMGHWMTFGVPYGDAFLASVPEPASLLVASVVFFPCVRRRRAKS
jgi:hypothetical protein